MEGNVTDREEKCKLAWFGYFFRFLGWEREAASSRGNGKEGYKIGLGGDLI